MTEMFCKIKHWSQRLLDRRSPESVELRKESARRILRPQSLYNPATSSVSVSSRIDPIPEAGVSDPRELPRPAQFGIKVSSKRSTRRRSILRYCYMNPVCRDNNEENDQDDHYNVIAAGCICINCKALPLLTECGVCLEPLQGQTIHSCPICSNLTCQTCALRLQNCAFCRTIKQSLPNIALQRLLERLVLPCKNFRSGCTELINGDNRIEHEASCSYGCFGCPVGSYICGWHGNGTSVKDHLQKIHDLRPIVDNGIAIEISGFQGKANAIDGRQYTVCLSCHHNLYVVKIVLFQGKLRLSFCQLLSMSSSVRGEAIDCARSYGVWFEVSSTCKVLKGALPFRRSNCDTREIEITCDNIISQEQNDSGSSVKINIVLKPITDIRKAELILPNDL